MLVSDCLKELDAELMVDCDPEELIAQRIWMDGQEVKRKGDFANACRYLGLTNLSLINYDYSTYEFEATGDLGYSAVFTVHFPSQINGSSALAKYLCENGKVRVEWDTYYDDGHVDSDEFLQDRSDFNFKNVFYWQGDGRYVMEHEGFGDGAVEECSYVIDFDVPVSMASLLFGF